MSLSSTNVGIFPFRVVKGVTAFFLLTITGYPDLRDITWTAQVTDLSTKDTLFAPTVSAPTATTLLVTFPAEDLDDLKAADGKYGYNVSGTLAGTVYMPVKGRLDVERSDT